MGYTKWAVWLLDDKNLLWPLKKGQLYKGTKKLLFFRRIIYLKTSVESVLTENDPALPRAWPIYHPAIFMVFDAFVFSHGIS